MGAKGDLGNQVRPNWVVAVVMVMVGGLVHLEWMVEGAMGGLASPDWMVVGAMGGLGSLVRP